MDLIETGFYEYNGDRSCYVSFSSQNSWSQYTENEMLESLETTAQFPSLLLQWSPTGVNGLKTELQREKSKAAYYEIRYIVSGTRQEVGPKCFLIFGFKIQEGNSGRYFEDNWKEVSGLARVLLFLSYEKYKLNRASLLKIQDGERGEFEYLVVVETYPLSGQLIYLLDLVQRTREDRNTGYLSLYKSI